MHNAVGIFIKPVHRRVQPDADHQVRVGYLGQQPQGNLPQGLKAGGRAVAAGAFEGVSIAPQSGAAQDFTNPVTYAVTLSDGSTRTYTVTVTVSTPPAGEAEPEPLKQPSKTFQKAKVGRVRSWANVRSGPGTEYPPEGRAYLDETIELLEWSEDGQWCKVRFDNGTRIGWLYYKFIITAE